MTRGQLSIEFFLILAVVMVMASMLLSNALEQMKEVRKLDDAALAKSAVDGITNAVNFAKLSGDGATLKRDVFVPKDVICFIKKGADDFFSCDVGLGKQVRGIKLLDKSATVTNACYAQGWLAVTVKNNAGTVEISC